jgi:hypothetical protein
VIFEWTRGNIDHIAEHGVTPFEAEFVVRHAAPPWPLENAGRLLVWGQTSQGRYLQVILVMLEEDQVDAECLSFEELIRWSEEGEKVAKVIHSRDLTSSEKHSYRKRRKNRR